jgi:hypothetical protein
MSVDLLSILIGAGIAAIVRRWFARFWWALVPLTGIAVGFLFNAVFDLMAYGDFFRHPREIVSDAISFSGWGLIAYAVFWLVGTVRRMDMRDRS